MEAMIKGISVILYNKVKVGEDGFGAPIYNELPVVVENVLVGEPSTEDINTALDLTGKVAKYTLAIPKGDTHEWEDKTVEFFSEKFRTVGSPMQGIESNIPLAWNKKVKVVRYE